jgi:hypothetical protein
MGKGLHRRFPGRLRVPQRHFRKLAGQYLDSAFRKMVAAFETRAEALYGSSRSSATSVA